MSKLIKVSQDTVVRLLTIVFTPVAAAGSAWAAKQGLNLPVAEVTLVAALAGAAVLGLGTHWLLKQPVVLKAESDLEALAAKISAGVKTDPALAGALSVLISKVESQRTEILAVLEKAAHASPSVENVLSQLLAAAAAKNAPEPTSFSTAAPVVADGGPQTLVQS